MKKFIGIIKEMNRTLNNIVLFNNLLNAILIFLAAYILLSIIDFRPFLAIIPAIAYLAYFTYNQFIKDKAEIVEEKYEPLKEKLRTAEDNLNMDNPIVDALQEEVAGEMKNVRVSSFVDQRKISYRILAAIVLCFLIVLLSTFNTFINFDILRDKLAFYKIINNDAEEGISDIPAAGTASNEDIYGEDSIATLGNEVIDVEIKPVSYELVGSASEEEEEGMVFEETFPEEVFATSAEEYGESIPIEKQELVKEYFKKLAGG